MKKILFIDPLSPEGHVQYNRYWIKALRELNLDFETIFRESYTKNFELSEECFKLPEELYLKIDSTKNFFLKRYYLFKVLLYIKRNFDLEKYDFIIYSSFENFSYYIYKILFREKNSILILHNNIQKLNNYIVKKVLKNISSKNKLISLSEEIKIELEKKGIISFRVTHPIPEPIEKKKKKKEEKLVVFSPSKSSIDDEIIQKIFESKKIKKNQNLKLILRSSNFEKKDSNILITKKFYKQMEYNDTFNSAAVILLPYKSSFQNRVSNVFFEAIANNKILLIKKGTYLDAYSFEKNILYFENILELEEILEEIKDKEIEYTELKNKVSFELMKRDIYEIIGEKIYEEI